MPGDSHVFETEDAEALEAQLSVVTSQAAIQAIAVDQAQERARAVASQFVANGCCVVENALSASCIEALSNYVDTKLQEAQEIVANTGEDESKFVGELFGKLRCRKNRWDVKLPLDEPVKRAMLELGSSLGALLVSILGEAALLTELSSIVSDPGSAEQPLHADAQNSERSGLLSVLIALQPVGSAMGPTIVCPGTHSPAGRALLGLAKPSGSGGGDETRANEQGYQDEALARLRGVPVCYAAGSALLYDSRLIHCGGSNLLAEFGGARRRVFVTTWLDVTAQKAPRGSSCTIRKEVRGQIRLRDVLPETIGGRFLEAA
eukprot:TRINITY_DN20476_c0_g1_i2.p1 TRINITY_DN20476_c0_g1~~TRINITY_DN20476_c0_g1_i2.p1  ORF type:complete len:332 (+),score=60.84 TRINITY_DN20476_c0_g1_i2:41-997(+)